MIVNIIKQDYIKQYFEISSLRHNNLTNSVVLLFKLYLFSDNVQLKYFYWYILLILHLKKMKRIFI